MKKNLFSLIGLLIVNIGLLIFSLLFYPISYPAKVFFSILYQFSKKVSYYLPFSVVSIESIEFGVFVGIFAIFLMLGGVIIFFISFISKTNKLELKNITKILSVSAIVLSLINIATFFYFLFFG